MLGGCIFVSTTANTTEVATTGSGKRMENDSNDAARGGAYFGTEITLIYTALNTVCVSGQVIGNVASLTGTSFFSTSGADV